MTLPDPNAISATQAAWSAANAAWWSVGASAIGATANVAVLLYLAVRTSIEARRARNSRLYSVAISISHALEIVNTSFERIADIEPATNPLNLNSVRRDIGIAKRAIEATTNDIDDADLMVFRRNTATLVDAVDQQTAGFMAASKLPAAAQFLAVTGPPRSDAETAIGDLDRLSRRWKKHL